MEWLYNGSREAFCSNSRHCLLTPKLSAFGVKLRGLIAWRSRFRFSAYRGSLHRSRQGPVPFIACVATLLHGWLAVKLFDCLDGWMVSWLAEAKRSGKKTVD